MNLKCRSVQHFGPLQLDSIMAAADAGTAAKEAHDEKAAKVRCEGLFERRSDGSGSSYTPIGLRCQCVIGVCFEGRVGAENRVEDCQWRHVLRILFLL